MQLDKKQDTTGTKNMDNTTYHEETTVKGKEEVNPQVSSNTKYHNDNDSNNNSTNTTEVNEKVAKLPNNSRDDTYPEYENKSLEENEEDASTSWQETCT